MMTSKDITVSRTVGVTVVRVALLFPILLAAKAVEKVKEHRRTVVCVLVACAAVVGIFLVSHSYQMKVWKEEAAKDPAGFARVDWTLARLTAREVRENPCFYVSVLGSRNTIRTYGDQMMVLEEVLGDWDRWNIFEVSPDGEAKLVGQRDLLNSRSSSK